MEGKIPKADVPPGSDEKKIHVTWSSVMDYVNSGGFKHAKRGAKAPEVKPANSAVNETSSPEAVNEGEVGSKPKPSLGGSAPVRKNPPLRVFKDSLRRLGFHDLKAIRDWADNRLLTVLRPEPAVLPNPESNQAA